MTGQDQKPVIGVLALQGAVQAHQTHIEKAGGKFIKVRRASDLQNCDGLILPGGESTTMLKLIDRFDLETPLKAFFETKAVWGVCAGCILMASKVSNPEQKSFGLLPVDVRRNAYGRQIDSHKDRIDAYQVSFIRAPVIESCDPGVTVLAEHQGSPAWVLKGRHMASTFHPELNPDAPSPLHTKFIDIARS